MELIPNAIEWQLLASVFSGTNDERETVLNRLRPDHFVSDSGKEIAQRVWNEFKHIQIVRPTPFQYASVQ